MKKVFKVVSCLSIVGLLYTMGPTNQLDAATSSGGSSSSSSSSASSSSSSSSSAARSSTSSSSSMSRSSAANASRSARQSSQRAAEQAARTSSINSNAMRSSAKQKQGANQYSRQTRSLLNPKRRYSSSSPMAAQYLSTGFYNNWLFYYLIATHFHDQENKDKSYQLNMLKQQMKKNESLYTVTIKTKHGDRVIVLPKKQYDKIQTGDKVKIKNGIVQP
ncbi:hypothetical protein E2556_05355 [Staphylococcus croceilyticus]|uniref:Proteophosphoglycan 5 n=1 Tax=Staphylococcus croceilyticus TaxID=319942 RepID=A0ABY2KDD6_9STAP|nr:hypothetical protein [Staphylococcus croceilyticus]PNZ67774.1 hypothetical protein CD128_07425 [Staphylococcus croceilyticus]TGA79640.1 hypothetical protein E2556_05355 [Staphylococcus croceilyticus]